MKISKLIELLQDCDDCVAEIETWNPDTDDVCPMPVMGLRIDLDSDGVITRVVML